MNLMVLMRKPDNAVLRRDGVVQIDLFGSLVIGPSAEALTNTLDVVVGKYDHVVINMAKVDRLDARGVGCLVQAYAAGCAKGTRISLCNLSPAIQGVLIVVKLLAVFSLSAEDFAEAA